MDISLLQLFVVSAYSLTYLLLYIAADIVLLPKIL